MRRLRFTLYAMMICGVAHAAPVITSYSPTNNAQDVLPSVWPVATFNTAITSINSGVITITNLNKQTATTITIPSQQIVTSGNTLTIRPEVTLNRKHTYAILIGPNAIEDLGGTNFAGIANTTTWRFTNTEDKNWSLVAYWPLNEGPAGPISNGYIFDDVIDRPDGDEVDAVSNNGGSYTNDPTRGMVWRTTEGNRAQAGRTEMNRNFTWQCWAKSVGGDNSTMMGTRDGSYARFFPNSMAADGYGISWSFNGSYNDNEWHHFILQRDIDTFKVYVDGVFDSQLVRDRGDNNMKLELGGSSRYQEDFDGYMSDIAIWDEVLTEERIQELANGFPVIIGPPQGTVIRLY